MSTLRPSGLQNLESAVDVTKLTQENFEIINESPAFQRVPTKRNGVPNTSFGPPTTGTWSANNLWVDVGRSLWVCSIAGAPGTWVQLDPYITTVYPSDPVPVGYQIIRPDLDWRRYVWGGSSWDELYLSIQGGTMKGSLILDHDPVEDLEAATKQYVDSVGSDKKYTFTQMVPSNVWPAPGDTPSGYIEHNLGKKPSVMIVDDYDQVWVGEITYINDNQVSLTFENAISGKAYFN